MKSVRTFEMATCSTEELVEAKAGRTVSVCIPCRDEAATVGPLITSIRKALIDRVPLVDQLLVIDDRSTDDTAGVAGGAGAEVVPIEKIHLEHGEGHGKGNVLWASLLASSGDFVVWLDGDITSFHPDWVVRLLAPLLDDDSVALVKAFAHRPQTMGGGGRTTELVARPLMSLYFPEIAALQQPLAGEYAGRREVLEQLPFVQGWGVEMALLIDVAQRFGADAIAQIDVGVREHRHRSLESLSVQAAEVMATILGRVPDGSLVPSTSPYLQRADGSRVRLNLDERPPVATVR
ncbi:MAG TPA: glucosyl-3-phosphoglycerate synthase [Ilumatobacter sp.]|nr:glucosyl-3-phosphoglycerate synthase [Ilumatobacter sp.]